MRRQSSAINRTHAFRIGALAAVLAIVSLLVSACSNPPANNATEVIAIDRTRSTDVTGTWPQEVAGIVKEQTLRAFDDHLADLVLTSIGSNLGDTAKVAEVSLHVDCANANVCNDDREAVANQVARAAGTVAGTSVKHSGTDIIGGINTAKAICATSRCVITLVSDGGDSRLAARGTAVDLAARHAGELTNLTGVTVRLIGLGADDADTFQVERRSTFWRLVLRRAGASAIAIARSL